MSVLDEAAAHNPGAWWWLKADGCDVNKGLKESAKLKWSGDVDLSDGSLQEQYDQYKQRLERAGAVGLDKGSMVQDLTCVVKEVSEDLDFLQSGECEQHNTIVVLYVP